MSENTDREVRRLCARLDGMVGLPEFDPTCHAELQSRDLYRLIRWHSGGKRPPLDFGFYRRQRLERMLMDELGLDRRTAPSGFSLGEYEDIFARVEAAHNDHLSAVSNARREWKDTFTKASDLDRDGEE